MKQLSAEECIARIMKDIEKRKTVDYADKNSVRRYNAGMDRIKERANYLCDNYPDKMDLFTALLDHPDYSVAATCTSILFSLRNATREHRLAALASAKKMFDRELNAIHEFMWQVNIERWEKKLLEECEEPERSGDGQQK
jgi:hypothetical protein